MDLSKNYYEILGVSSTIEPEALKAVFRALAKKYHPDTTAKTSTSKRFRDIQEAFDILSDPELRKKYDREKLNAEGKTKNTAQAQQSKEQEQEQEQAPRKLDKIKGIHCAALIVTLLVAAYFLKNQIVHMFPATAGLYYVIGIGGEELGAGLKIQNVISSRKTEKGQEVLIIRGLVKNISDVLQTVPMIQVDLFDGDAHSIQNSQAAPVRNKLDPGKVVGFKVRLVEPSPRARKLEVTFKKPEDSEGQNEKPKAGSQ
jgi:hypothetical protein